MSRKQVVPWLLAASVLLTGATAVTTLGSFTPAYALTSVEELRDVNSSHWAYEALADLVEKYDVIEGYPDYTFRGNRPTSRWELAAALNALIKAVGRDLARLGAEKADKADLMKLARLQEEFKNELAALNSRVDALEGRASAIEAKNVEQDTRLDLLERTQLHGDLSVGVLADFAGNGDPIGGTPATTGGGGIQDGISSLGRVRLGVKVPVVPGYDNSRVGEGDVIARLVGAFGRWAPAAGAAGTTNINPISGYSAIAGGASAFNEGVRPSSLTTGITTGLNTRQNLYVESAYYKQHYKSGIPLLTDLLPGVNVFPDNDSFRTTADLYVGIVPWRNLFNRSPYRGDELNQYQNTALVNNAGLLVNNITPTLALAWHQGLGEHFSADLTGAVGTLDVADALSGLWITEELAFNYDTSFLFGAFTKPGSLYVGGYHYLFEGNSNPRQLTGGIVNRDGEAVFFNNGGNNSLNAFYAGWNQEWWRGMGTSVDYVLNETGANNAMINALRNGTGANVSFLTAGGRAVGIQQALSAVLTMPLTTFNADLTKRAKDVIGLGYSWIQPQGNLGDTGVTATFNDTDEHVFEAFYRFAVNDNVTIIPSVQAIINRFGVGQNDADILFGLRTNYVF